MADQTVIDLKQSVPHRAAVIRQLKTVAASENIVRPAHDVWQFGFRMNKVDEILIIEGMRDLKAVPFLRFVCESDGRPCFDEMKCGLDYQQIARCVQLEGLYDQPCGTSGPGSMLIPGAIGIPGARMAKATTSMPTSVSLL